MKASDVELCVWSPHCGAPPLLPLWRTRSLPTEEETRLPGTAKETGQGLRVEASRKGYGHLIFAGVVL